MPPQTSSAKRQAIAKTAPSELLYSGLFSEVFSPADWESSTIKAETLDLAGVAVKRLTSLLNNGAPDIQAGALDVIQDTVSGPSATRIARTVMECMSSVVDKSVASKAQDLLQLLASMCHALVSIQQQSQAQNIATPFIEQVIVKGSTTSQLGAAGAKPSIMVLWHLQSFVPVQALPSSLIEDILAGIDVSGESSYRGRVISALIQNPAYIQTLGFQTSDEAIATFLKQWYTSGELSRSDLSAISIHLLPLLLEKRAKLAQRVLQDLRESSSTTDQAGAKYAYIPAWTAIARIGVVTSGLKLAELDSPSLECAINHGDDEIRLGAWFILSQCPSPTDQIEKVALGEDGLLFRSFANNMAVSNMEFRNDYLASFGRFVERLYTSANFAMRQSQKPLAISKRGDVEAEKEFEQQRAACKAYVTSAAEFVEFLLKHFIDTSIFLPMSTYHARIITALSMLSYLEEYLGSRKTPKKAGKNQVTWPTLFTKERVEYLIACLGSNFTDVRNQAAGLLQHAPYPLPGFEDPSSSDLLLEAALDRLNGARNTDAEAGGLMIQVLYHSLQEDAHEVSPQQNTRVAPELELFFSIYARLEERLSRISGSATLAEEPLHGLILAMIRIVSCWTEPAPNTDYTDITRRIVKSVQQIWDICRPIIATQQGDDNEHEIAGAYEVLEGNRDELEQVQESDTNKADNIHLTILSNCWRAIKEASDLVATVYSKVPVEAVTLELASAAGDLYMRWLRHIRHRGTFSSMAVSFETFLDSPAIPYDERKAWLQQQLDFIAQGDAETTRRSGALPYAVLALVHGDMGLFDKAFLRLTSIVADSSRDSAKIHAMHSIRVMLLDARHSHLFKRYFQKSIITSLDAYETENWSVRNAALLLSANLTNRAIGKSLNDLQYRNSRRPTLHEWVKLYPHTFDHFETILERSRVVAEMDPATFIVLLILRSLDTTLIAGSAVVPSSLIDRLKPLLAKREIKARQAAAQALANLSSVTEMLAFAGDLCQDLERQERNGLNEIHGRLITLEASLSSEHPGRKSVRAMTELKRRFSRAAGLEGWPALITDTLHSLVDIMEGLSTSTLKEHVAETGPSTVKQANITDILADDLLNRSGETMRLLRDGADSHSGTVDLWKRLYHTYTSTLNEPLKNVLLPVLGRIAPTVSASSMQEVLGLIGEAGQDHKSEDSRRAAVSALRPLAEHLRQSMPQQLFSIADLLLHDDDATIRSQAAECIGVAFGAGYPICQEVAEKRLWLHAMEHFKDTGPFAEQLLAELMDPHDIEQLLRGLKSREGDLFAEEPANLYVEPYSRKQQLFVAFCRLGENARRNALQACQERVRLCQLSLKAHSEEAGEANSSTPLDKGREGLIMLQQLSRVMRGITA